MKVEAVIGANYGDEGKGLFTDYLCANRPNPIVIMTNGGSQRGHTVELPNGTRHVFHHFSSGTFRGAITYFPKTYMLNPMQFVKEYEELTALGYLPKTYRDPACTLQLPCDIALNWHIEKMRGDKKHGSVGCGIWETKFRMYNGDSCTLDDFCNMSYDLQFQHIKSQAMKYRDMRCEQEGFSKYADIYDLFLSKGFIDHFIADCKRMRDLCESIENVNKIMIYPETATYIFENGQGLKLDQFYSSDDIANTTPSFTGSIGIARLLNEFGLSDAEISLNYISRTYLTKHGAGKFKEQSASDEGLKFDDVTNVNNEWQDSLRFAKLDYNDLLDRCNKDTDMLKKMLLDKSKVEKHIVITHANECEIDSRFSENIDYVSSSKFSKDIVSKIV